MKFYIATRFSNEQYRLQAIQIKESLEALGHTMTFDWMSGDSVKPYEQNLERTAETAKCALDGATEADFFILLAEPKGTGMYVEFDAALAQSELTGRPKIFVMGEEKYCSMFNFHPQSTFVESLDEVIAAL